LAAIADNSSIGTHTASPSNIGGRTNNSAAASQSKGRRGMRVSRFVII
jgi:hypothetical protein